MQSSRLTVKGGCSRSASSGQAPVSSFTGTKLWARRGKPLSWLSTERNWCSSGNWVSQSLWSQNQPASISIHHLLLLHQWVSKPLSSVSMFYTLHPLTESGSRRQACSCTEETSRQPPNLRRCALTSDEDGLSDVGKDFIDIESTRNKLLWDSDMSPGHDNGINDKLTDI